MLTQDWHYWTRYKNNNNNNIAFQSQASWGRLELKPTKSPKSRFRHFNSCFPSTPIQTRYKKYFKKIVTVTDIYLIKVSYWRLRWCLKGLIFVVLMTDLVLSMNISFHKLWVILGDGFSVLSILDFVNVSNSKSFIPTKDSTKCYRWCTQQITKQNRPRSAIVYVHVLKCLSVRDGRRTNQAP